MLPNPLVSLYQQYKQDTNAVASWLASTAKSCGYPADLLQGSSSKVTSTVHTKRLKGKARKQAKAVGSQPTTSDSVQPKPDYIIAIKDFIPLAEYVAAARKPTISVPQAFDDLLKRVIEIRSGFGARLAEHGTSPSITDEVKHSYFVGVLEKVREVLKPRIAHLSQDADHLPTPSDTAKEVGGKFAGLNVYEPSEEFLNVPAIERVALAKHDNATYVTEQPQDLEETLFCYTLLINDLMKIRSRIEWIWTNYRDGIFELVTAAVATNTACDLARNLMEDMTPTFQANGGAMEIATQFYVYQSLEAGFSPNEVVNPKDEFNYDTYDIATDTYVVSFTMINAFLKAWNPDALPLYKEGMYGIYDPSRDWSTMTKREKFQQDKILMMETFSELATMVKCIPDYPVHDEFIRGMQELNRTREIPMYLAFAAQIFLDIHHILREKVYSAHITCMHNMAFIDKELRVHLDFHENLRINNWPVSNDQMLKQLRAKIKWVMDDPIYKPKAKAFSRMGVQCTSPVHRLLQYSPVISGLMLYHFRAQIYNAGLTIANAWGSLTYPLHLYIALRQEKLLSQDGTSPKSWADMEVMLALLDSNNFYVGSELPGNPQDYFTKFCLQMGTTVSAFAKNKDKRKHNFANLHSKSGPRSIKQGNCTPVSDMFVDRYVKNTGQVEWTPEHVETVIKHSLWEEEGSEEDGTLTMSQIDDPKKLQERKRNIAAGNTKVGQKNRKTNNGTRMSPGDLIRALTFALNAESIIMAFPYLCHHRTSWIMLRQIGKACDPLLIELYGPEYMEKENQLPWVVGWILMALVQGDDRLLVRAGEALRDLLNLGLGTKTLEQLQSIDFNVEIQHD